LARPALEPAEQDKEGPLLDLADERRLHGDV
jgi:hypothetical protein